jgi:hypothetical protein
MTRATNPGKQFWHDAYQATASLAATYGTFEKEIIGRKAGLTESAIELLSTTYTAWSTKGTPAPNGRRMEQLAARFQLTAKLLNSWETKERWIRILILQELALLKIFGEAKSLTRSCEFRLDVLAALMQQTQQQTDELQMSYRRSS